MRHIQNRLSQLGLYSGKVDGLYGPKTKQALVWFQTMHGLQVTGRSNADTEQELFPPPLRDRTRWPNAVDLVAHFGQPGENQVLVECPWTLRLAWDPATTTRKIRCHRLVADSLQSVLSQALETYGRDGLVEIGADMYGGSLSVRLARGGSKMSTHAWGIAIDWDPARNRLRWGADRARLAKADCDPWWDIWEAAGWVSLGRKRNYDWMHVQASELT